MRTSSGAYRTVTSAWLAAGVLERVGEALLDDPVGGEVDALGERKRLAVDVELDREPGAADLAHQRVEAVEPGLGRQLEPSPSRRITASSRRISVRAARPACSTPLQRVAVLGAGVGELVPDGADLQHHHADGVRDDVVQLPRDPRALIGDGDARRRVALAARPRCARTSAASACSARSRTAKPASQQIPNSTGMKTSWLAGWPGAL